MLFLWQVHGDQRGFTETKEDSRRPKRIHGDQRGFTETKEDSRRPKRIHGDHIAKDLFRLREKIEIMHKVSHFYYVILLL